MQFSSNSNEAIRALIRACPTPAGQYRQAVLQLRDREMALRQYQRSCEQLQIQIEIKTIRKNKLVNQCLPTASEVTIAQLKARLIELEIQEITDNLKSTSELVEDAIREIECCAEEIQRIITETGVDFSKIKSSEFQLFMADDFKLKRVRFLAARMLGLPAEAAETLLEIPDDQREEYMQLLNEVLIGAGYKAPALETKEQLLNGVN